MNTLELKYQQKSKSISSAETNYFVHFAMRYPVFAENHGRGVTTEETGETTISPEFSDETTVSPNFSDMLTLSESEGTVIITNTLNNMVLSVGNGEKINWLEAVGVNNTNQTWIVGVPFSHRLQEEECFTLQNPDSGLFLTAIGPNELEIQGISNPNFAQPIEHKNSVYPRIGSKKGGICLILLHIF